VGIGKVSGYIQNLRIIENLKSELLEDIAALYRHWAIPVQEDTGMCG
jgi:hypothetical protein